MTNETGNMPKHYLRVILEAGDGILSQIICTGDEQSSCWNPLDTGDDPQPYGHCALAEWNNETDGIINGEIQFEIELDTWGDDEPVMSIKKREKENETYA